MMETDNQNIQKQTLATRISYLSKGIKIGTSKMNSDEARLHRELKSWVIAFSYLNLHKAIVPEFARWSMTYHN